MAQSDRQRLLERALALPQAHASDFFGDRRAPHDADPTLLKRIDDTALRTKLVETGIAVGLQSPKGPQKIASILRIYPDFDAPGRTSSGSRAAAAAPPQQQRGLPSVDEMEALIGRIREIEGDVAHELSAEVDERVAHLKRARSPISTVTNSTTRTANSAPRSNASARSNRRCDTKRSDGSKPTHRFPNARICDCSAASARYSGAKSDT
ncbi:MAG: hypothetical protein NVS1B2_07400 [Vulcanimicrobiaceae bacterium]